MSSVNPDVDVEPADRQRAAYSHSRMAYLIKRLESAVRRDLDAAMHEHGLTTPQYAALSILVRHPGMSSAQLARRAFVSAQSMQVMVAGFLRADLIERRPQPENQRVLCNYLTEAGHAALASCEQAADGVENKMLDGLDETTIAILRDALATCVRNLGRS